MASVTDELTATVAASWRCTLEGTPGKAGDAGRVHWQTKTNYYRAAAELLHDSEVTLTWEKIIQHVRPEGNRGTFYRVIGSSAAHPLLREYRTTQRGYGADIANLYNRPSAVQQLVDEIKVWTYWQYRKGWIGQLQLTTDVTRRRAAQSLVRVTMEWATCHPEVARALDCSPPMAAVEDLVLIWGAADSARAANSLLRDVTRFSLGPLGTTTNGVLKSITEQLDQRLPSRGQPTVDRVTALAGTAFDTIRWLSTLPSDTRGEEVRSVVTVLKDALADLQRFE